MSLVVIWYLEYQQDGVWSFVEWMVRNWWLVIILLVVDAIMGFLIDKAVQGTYRLIHRKKTKTYPRKDWF